MIQDSCLCVWGGGRGRMFTCLQAVCASAAAAAVAASFFNAAHQYFI